jgi:predicted dehydrogenase
MYKVAVCGLRHGHIGSIIGQIEKHPEMQVVAVAEENAAEGKKILGNINLEITHGSVDELLKGVDFDILAVGDVYAKRGQEVIRGLKAGKNIISDKPLCTSIEELEQIVGLSSQKGLGVMVALDLRFHASIQTAAKLVQAGEIGDVSNIAVFGLHPLSFRTGRPDWYFEKGLHGGTINDLMIHGVDALNMITGYPVTEVVGARAWNFEIPEIPFFQDAAQGLLRLANGAGVIFDVSYKAVPGHSTPWTFRFWGTGGEIFVDLSSPDVVVRQKGRAEKKVPAEGKAGDYVQEVIKEIKGEGGERILTTRECLESTRQTLLIQKAADLKKAHLAV